jgi:metallo-beta-lactamase family protein
MYITFHGAARSVTGSKHLLEVNGTSILLDCGLVQGRRKESAEANRNLPFDCSKIDLMILSHAHIDHSGNIPNLVKNGFTGDIICTPATRDLCSTMLRDSGHIQERDAEFVNKKRARKGEAPVEPIYTQDDAVQSLNYFVTMNYYRRRKIAEGVHLTFYDAGHMLGSTIVVLDIIDQETSRERRLVFSGDLGRENIPIIRDPDTIDGTDFLIMESTYGNRTHASYPDAEKRLEKIVNETYRAGGALIMPAFAVGRTQQIVYTLHRLWENGDIPHIPIYVDSPLAVDATSVFQLHPETYDEEIRQFISDANVRNPFGFDDLTYIRSLTQSKQLNFKLEPCIIISASGMAEFGRVVHHLKNRIEDRKNTVLITGWQAQHTLGRRLVEGEKVVRIFGEEYEVKARVEVIDGFSGHADVNELTNWVGAMKKRPQKTWLVHGETESAEAFQQTLQDKFDMDVQVPYLSNRFEV